MVRSENGHGLNNRCAALSSSGAQRLAQGAAFDARQGRGPRRFSAARLAPAARSARAMADGRFGEVCPGRGETLESPTRGPQGLASRREISGRQGGQLRKGGERRLRRPAAKRRRMGDSESPRPVGRGLRIPLSPSETKKMATRRGGHFLLFLARGGFTFSIEVYVLLEFNKSTELDAPLCAPTVPSDGQMGNAFHTAS